MTYTRNFRTIELALLVCIFLHLAIASGSGGILTGAGFSPDLEKTPDSGRSQSRTPVQL